MRIHPLKLSSVGRSLPLRIFSLLFVAGLLLIPQPARGVLITEAVGLITGAIIGVYGIIINLEAALVQWLLDPETWGGAFTRNPTIVMAWRVMRDFANLGFVLAIVVIAIGFILRLQTYGSQKTLVRLIAAAILVNFSLVIAGVFIEIANTVSRFFLDSFQFSEIAASLIDATGIREVFLGDPDKPLVSRVFSFIWRQIYVPADIHAAGMLLLKFVVVSIFAIMLMAALGALIVMLLLRVAHLWVLLILAPMAWLMWIFPQFESNWKRWWTQFLRWTFFAPIVTFFLSFSISLISRTAAMPPQTQGNFIGGAADTFQDVFRDALTRSGESPNTIIARFAISIALIVMSMIIANEMGITFADKGVKWATAAGKWPGLTAWRTGIREGRRRFSTSAIGQRLEKRFAGSRLFGSVSDAIRQERLKPEQDIENLLKRYEHLDSATKTDILRGRGKWHGRGIAELIAAARSLSAREFNALSTAEQQLAVQAANSVSPAHAKELMFKNPKLATYYDTIARSPAEQVGGIRGFMRKMPINRVTSLPDFVLTDPDIIAGFVAGHFRAIANEIDTATVNAIRSQLHSGTPAMTTKLGEIMRHTDLASIFG